jgi:hypothetical protein
VGEFRPAALAVESTLAKVTAVLAVARYQRLGLASACAYMHHPLSYLLENLLEVAEKDQKMEVVRKMEGVRKNNSSEEQIGLCNVSGSSILDNRCILLMLGRGDSSSLSRSLVCLLAFRWA